MRNREALAAEARCWREDADGAIRFVRAQFGVEPDPDQAAALVAYQTSKRMGMKASKGTGKTAVLARIFNTPSRRRTELCRKATSVPGNDPLDILCPDEACKRIGVELGEWVNKDQIVLLHVQLTGRNPHLAA